MNLRTPPNLSSGTTDEKLNSLQSYLYQMVNDLNYTLNGESAASEYNAMTQALDNASNVFTSIKLLIMKSTDIINAYYRELKKKFDSDYASKTDLGEVSNRVETLEDRTALPYQSIGSDVFSFAQSCDNGLTPVKIADDDVLNLPDEEGFEDAIGTVEKASDEKIIVTLVSEFAMAKAFYKDDEWSDWKYITLL